MKNKANKLYQQQQQKQSDQDTRVTVRWSCYGCKKPFEPEWKLCPFCGSTSINIEVKLCRG